MNTCYLTFTFSKSNLIITIKDEGLLTIVSAKNISVCHLNNALTMNDDRSTMDQRPPSTTSDKRQTRKKSNQKASSYISLALSFPSSWQQVAGTCSTGPEKERQKHTGTDRVTQRQSQKAERERAVTRLCIKGFVIPSLRGTARVSNGWRGSWHLFDQSIDG